MRIGIVSDTHGSYERLEQAAAEMGPIDLLLHAGDGARDAERWCIAHSVEAYYVKGNCDFGPYTEEVAFPVAGRRVLLTHGHLYGVKNDLQRLAYRGRELQVDVAVFGHTHLATHTDAMGVKLVNPGSLSGGRSRSGATYALLHLSPDCVEVEICRLGEGPRLLKAGG